MTDTPNVKIVKSLYKHFGKGNIAGLLDLLADDIEWAIAGAADVPFAGTRRGRDEVAQFFKALGQAVEFKSFEPEEFFGNEDTVAVFGKERARARTTSKEYVNPWAMRFTLKKGKVSHLETYADTAAVAAAFRKR